MYKKLFMPIFLILLIGIVTAADWDNKLTYSNNDLKVDIDNSFLGLIKTTHVGTVELKSHNSVDEIKRVNVGDEIVMYYDFNNFSEIYPDGIGELIFIDVRTGNLIQKDYSLVYLDNEEYKSPIYKEECTNKDINGTKQVTCDNVLSGTETKTREVWKDYNSRNIPSGKMRIGVKVHTALYDYVDVIWTIVGKTIDRHASYQVVEVTSAHGKNQGTTASQTGKAGVIWKVSNSGDNIINFTIINITKANQSTSTTAYVQTAYGSGVLGSASFSGDIATFTSPVNISRETSYYILADAGGGSRTMNYGSSDSEYPIENNNGTYQVGINQAGGNDTGNVIEIASISYRYTILTGIDNAPIISTTHPKNNSNLTSNAVIFSGLVTDDKLLTNVSLYLDGTINQTNSSGQNNTLYNFSLTLNDGTYNWYYDAWDNASLQGVSSGMRFTIDTTPPKLNVTQPHGLFYHTSGNSLKLNWNYTDTNPGICRYQYKGVNTTITCSDNTSTISGVTNLNNVTLTFFSNDSLGSANNTIITWNYSLWENDRGSKNTTFEGLTELYYIDFTILSGSLSLTRMWYEGNDTGATFSSVSNRRYNASINDFIVPETDANKVSTFFWEVDYGTTQINTTTSSQHINTLSIDDCSSNNFFLYNFTMVDEGNKTRLLKTPDSNTTANLNIQIYSYSTTNEIASYNTTYLKTNPFTICLNNNSLGAGQYSHDLQVQYLAKGFETELYHIQNETLNTSIFSRNITLYDLNSTNSQVFKIIYKNSAFLPVTDALIKIYRKYINDNSFKIVEIPKTDDNGETTSHLVVNDVIYNFEIVKYGQILATFDNVLAVCQTPLVTQCEINFNAEPKIIDVPDFTQEGNFNYTLGYDSSTKTVSSSFRIPSGGSELVTLNVTITDTLGTNVCTDQLRSSSGTLSCIVSDSFGNATVIAKLYKSGVLQSQGSVKINQDPSDIYGVSLVILALFIMFTLIGAGLSDNPIYTVIFLMVGVGLLFALNLVANNGFIGSTATILFLIIAIILVIIKGARRN